MRKALVVLFSAMMCVGASAESLLQPVNDLGYGTWNARVQTLSMYRDYESATPGNASATTAALMLSYTTPELAGFSAGLSWIYAEPLDAGQSSNQGKTLLSNGRVNLLNEAWIRYRFDGLGLSNTVIKAGRQVLHGEVFRDDGIRQKPRSVEAVQLTSTDVPNLSLTIGHAFRMSNVLDNETSWHFNDFDEVPAQGAGCDSRGITWGEAVYTGITNLEAAAYEAYVHDIANVVGGRTRVSLSDQTDFLGYFQHASSVQTAERIAPFHSDMYSLAVAQKIGGVALESGWFGVQGGDMLFQEMTTGLNHPLGNSLMVYSGHFNGGSDSLYLKATAKIGQTALYMLYNYTRQDHRRHAFDGQELNVIAKRALTERLSVTVKLGAGYQDWKNAANRTGSDARLFVTCNF